MLCASVSSLVEDTRQCCFPVWGLVRGELLLAGKHLGLNSAEHYASYSQVAPMDTAVLQLEMNIQKCFENLNKMLPLKDKASLGLLCFTIPRD